MTKNVGTVDRTLRVIVALVIAALYFAGTINGTVAIVLGVVAVLMVVTGFAAWCPAYLPFGLSTCARKAETAAKA